MSPANRIGATGNDFPRLRETTVVSMNAQNAIIGQMPPLSTVKQAAP
jgi:hypothetical protein